MSTLDTLVTDLTADWPNGLMEDFRYVESVTVRHHTITLVGHDGQGRLRLTVRRAHDQYLIQVVRSFSVTA
jgi:hypothetical protein